MCKHSWQEYKEHIIKKKSRITHKLSITEAAEKDWAEMRNEMQLVDRTLKAAF